MMNLLTNAIDACDEGGTVTVRTRAEDRGVRIEVADTGCGIEPEHRDRIFDPFFTTKPVGQGTGLGLSISYGIIQDHGGTIEVESTVGKGTCFIIHLPLRPPAPPRDGRPLDSPRVGAVGLSAGDLIRRHTEKATDAMDATPLNEAIRAYFQHDRSRMTMMAARQFDVPEQAVLEALVGDWPIVRLDAGAFRTLMEALPALGTMRVFVRSRAAVIESVGTFGGFSETGPFFNVQTDTLDMHILHAEIGAIFAVEKWGHDTDIATHSFQFFDRAGNAAFKAFLWENFPDVPADRIEAFRALTRALSVPSGEPAPDPNAVE